MAMAASSEELALLAKGGDREALQQLWKNNRGILWAIVNAHIREHGLAPGVDAEDLLQQGYFAIVDAVAAYDPAAGWKFNTYLRYPMQTYIAEACGYRTSKRDAMQNADSLDRPIGDAEDDGTLADIVEDPRGEAGLEAVEDEIFRQQLHAAELEALSKLTPAQCDVLTRIYFGNQTMQQISDTTGTTYTAVRLARDRGIKQLKLKHWRELQQFVDLHAPSFIGGFRPTENAAINREVLTWQWINQRRGGGSDDAE